MRALRLAFGRGGPAMAVAQTVLSEAVRMKISVVFIVMLVFLLACLPMLLDEEALLRYRVQSFLQYSVGGTFWTLAMLTLFFSVGTVAFEQRDRIIWQTMSKPISPLGYLLGKWVGVMSLNAALLAVSATGVFLFTEHLRQQPAEGERVAFVNGDGSLEQTADRRLLESQVLVARRGVRPTLEGPNPEELQAVVQRRLDEAIDRDPSLRQSPALASLAAEFEQDEVKEFLRQQRTIEPGQGKRFTFEGLGQFAAKARRMAEAGREPPALTLRTKVHAGADNPNSLYRVTYFISGEAAHRDVPLDIAQSEPMRPEAVDDRGRLVIDVVNGDTRTGETNHFPIQMNAKDFEVLYPAGGYEWNFARVMLLTWAKLGFIAAVGVAAATCLSFPVACLLTLLVLLASESAGYLSESLQYFPIMGEKGDAFSVKGFFIQVIAWPIAQGFAPYAQLKPTSNLVDGRLVPLWGMVRAALAITGAGAGAMFLGWLAFRRRELATYSGH
jgi:ABC-type transport system involved in multi-copper enzyme maturation permease subunit